MCVSGRRERNESMNAVICIDCAQRVGALEVFPGPRCLTCWTPIGEAQARTMTAHDLVRMWGGK